MPSIGISVPLVVVASRLTQASAHSFDGINEWVGERLSLGISQAYLQAWTAG
jgi:hypothetical protein